MPMDLLSYLFKLNFKGSFEMPKMKTKSSAKGRFKVTSTGKVLRGQCNKRHNMRKRSKRQIRDNRGTTVACAADTKIIMSYMPYDRKVKRG